MAEEIVEYQVAFVRFFPGLAWASGDEVYEMRFEFWDALRRQADILMDR